MKREIHWEKEKKTAGSRLCLPRKGSWYDCLLLFCGALLCVGSAYRQLCEMLGGMEDIILPEHTWSYVLFVAAVLSAVYGSGVLGRAWIRLLPLVPVAWGFGRYYLLHRLALEDGILYVLRMYVREMSSYYGRSFLFPVGVEEEAPTALFFWLLLLFIGVFVLSEALQRASLMLILPLVMLCAGIAVGKVPGWQSIVLLFTAALLLRMYRSVCLERPGVRASQLAALLAICMLVGGVTSGISGNVLKQHDAVMERQLALEDAVLALPVWDLFSRDGTVTNDAPLGNGKEVLTISLSGKPTENVYLKTYAADHYENGRWSVRGEAFAQVATEQGMTAQEAGTQILNMSCEAGKDVLGPENAKAAVDYLAVAAPKQYDYTISCRNFGRSAPLPYASLLPEEFVADSDTAAQKPWMKREYSGTLTMGGSSVSTLTKYLYSYYITDLWSVKDMFLSDLSKTNGSKQKEEAETDWYSDYVWMTAEDAPVSEAVKKQLEKYLQIFGWMDAEEYRSYVQAMQEMGNASLTNALRMESVPMVQQLLADIGTYSRALDPLPSGTDPIDYFMNTSGEGYCVHFASAATLMLQSMGIPARFASGYVVFPKDFEKADDVYTAVVTDDRAHAWVEVYVEGFGWVPYEATPGFSSGKVLEETSAQTGQETDQTKQEHTDASEQHMEDQKKDQPADEQKEEQEQRTETNKAADGGEKSFLEEKLFGKTLFWWVGLLLMLLAGYFVVCLTVDGIRMYKRKQEQLIRRELSEGHGREAIFRINRRMYRMLAARELLIGRSIRDDVCFVRALRWFSAFREAAVDVELYMKLVRKAYFSDEEMPVEDAETVYAIYEHCRLSRNERIKIANTAYGNTGEQQNGIRDRF